MFLFFQKPLKLNELEGLWGGGSSLKNAGNNSHFSGNRANFSGNGADPLDSGNHRLLQKSFLFRIFGSRKT